MQRKKSRLAVILLMVVAALFGCQCGAPQNGFKGNGNNAGKPDDVAADPAEQPAVELVQKFGHVKQEGGHVVEVGIFKQGFTNADIKSLATLSKVRKIQINFVNLTGAGFKELAGLTELTELDVPSNPIDDAGFKEITTLKHLKILHLSGHKISGSAFKNLAALPDLEELAAGGSGIGDTGAVNIAASAKQLKFLALDNSQVGDAGVQAIADMPNLQTLHLYGARVTDAGLAALTKLKNLEVLYLSFGFTDKSAKIIAGCENLRTLKLFNNTELTEKGLQALGTLPNLSELEVNSPRISTDAKLAFIKAHPNINVK